MLKQLFILTTLIIFNFKGFTQSPTYFKIGEKEFANTDVYTVLYDENTDLIYAGTNNGLFVYKQNKFIKMDGPENQIGDSFFELKMDNSGNVFCENLNGQIFKVNQKTNSYSLFYDTEKEVGLSNGFWYFFLPDSELIIFTSESIKLLDYKGAEIISREGFKKELSGLKACAYTPEGVLLAVFDSETKRNKLYLFKDFKLSLIREFKFKNKKDSSIDFYRFSFLKKMNGVIMGIDLNGSISSDKKIVSDYIPNEKERYVYLNDSVFVGLNSQRGYRYFSLKNDTLKTSHSLFPNLFVSSFYQVKKGLQLLGTFGEGIIVIPNPEVIKHEFNYLFLGLATSPTNDVVLTTRSGEVFKVITEGIELMDKAPSNVDNVWYMGSRSGFKNFSMDYYCYNNTKNNVVAVKAAKRINKDLDLFVKFRSVVLVTKGKAKDLNNLFGTKYNNNTYSIATNQLFICVEWSERDSVFYYGSNVGVYSRGWRDSIPQNIFFNNSTFQANDLIVSNGNLICATKKYGVLFCLGNKVIGQLSVSDGLNSNNIKQIDVKNNILYILTDRGFQMYDLKKKKKIPIGVADGVNSFEITKFAVSKDKIWFLEKHNYFSIDIDKLFEDNRTSVASKLYFDSLVVNHNKVDVNTENIFDYTQNKFEFYYDYRDIVTKQETEIIYTLKGFYNDWKSISTFDNKIEFQSLPPGNYVFKLKSNYRNQEFNAFEYKFKITSPFWQTIWFYLFLGTFLISLVVIYYRNRIKKIKKEDLVKLEKQTLLTESIDSKLKALRSQMNPHFIFNSLNSIQALILKQDTEKSYDYVVMFADLVRKTLQYSDKDFINIEDELVFLETYLKLESLRMKKDFRYEINYSGNKSVKIPSLMIQPFIENAIHHGLLHKTGVKKLSINFSFDKEMTCIIIDNGIGREKAKAIKERQHISHKSFSLDATKQRMKIIEQQHGKNFGYKFFNEIPSGTKVILTIPFRFQF
ncbi:MAG: sensor histidine kinase YesM [bacterium]|jgi:sensor histidine kinase YesM